MRTHGHREGSTTHWGLGLGAVLGLGWGLGIGGWGLGVEGWARGWGLGCGCLSRIQDLQALCLLLPVGNGADPSHHPTARAVKSTARPSSRQAEARAEVSIPGPGPSLRVLDIGGDG